MRGLISDLLDAGRIEAGTLSVAPEPAEVAHLVDQARNTFLSGGGRTTVQIDLPADLPRVMADTPRIVQVPEQPLRQRLPALSRVVPHPGRRGAGWPSRGDLGPPTKAGACRPTGCRTCSESTPLSGARNPSAGSGGPAWAWPSARGWWRPTGAASGPRATGRARARGSPSRFRWPTRPATATRLAPPRVVPARLGEGREPTRILVVDDDPQALRYVRDALSAAGYAPVVTGDPQEVARLLKTKKPQLVLLDLMLPGTDGIELMQRVPAMADLPVIFISGYGRDETIARALETGADDYIVKPFSPTELVARVQAALRRRAEPEPFLLGDLAIHYEQRRVSMAGRPVPLTATEYELLRVLSLSAGRVVTYDALLRQAWSGRDSAGPKVVRAFVKTLRRKLGEDATRPAYIFNERGVGYRMAEPDDR